MENNRIKTGGSKAVLSENVKIKGGIFYGFQNYRGTGIDGTGN
jgi:hypothetical protein